MKLDELRTSRRSFLKMLGVGAAAATAATLGVHLPSVIVQQSSELVAERDFISYVDPLRMEVFADTLGCVFAVPGPNITIDPVDSTEVDLYWMGPDFSVGWWIDRMEKHEFRSGKSAVVPVSVVPEKMCVFETLGPDLIHRNSLGSFGVKPGELYAVGIRCFSGDPALDFSRRGDGWWLDTFSFAGGWDIVGLGITHSGGSM